MLTAGYSLARCPECDSRAQLLVAYRHVVCSNPRCRYHEIRQDSPTLRLHNPTIEQMIGAWNDWADRMCTDRSRPCH